MKDSWRDMAYSSTSTTASTTIPFTERWAHAKPVVDAFMIVLFRSAIIAILYGSYHYFSHR